MQQQSTLSFGRGSRTATALLTAALIAMAYCHAKDVGMKFDEHVYYMAYLFCANIAASVALAALAVFALVSGRARWLRRTSGAAVGLAVSTIAGFIWSRTIGFPQMADHIGEWDALGISSLVFEALVVAAAWSLLVTTRASGDVAAASDGRARIALVAGVTLAAVGAALVLQATTASADDSMVQMHYGNMSQYPDLAHASARNLRLARALHRRTLAYSTRFDTIAKAERLGYRANRAKLQDPGCPGLLHWRKRVRGALDPLRPQALVFWCDANQRFTLAAAMYRMPSSPLPPTYGGLLGWHRHMANGSWMTHVWLTRGTRAALATCAPIGALAGSVGITPASYVMGADGADAPCS